MVVVVVEVVVVEWDRRSGKGGKKIDGLLSPSNEYQSINQSIEREVTPYFRSLKNERENSSDDNVR